MQHRSVYVVFGLVRVHFYEFNDADGQRTAGFGAVRTGLGWVVLIGVTCPAMTVGAVI